MSKIEIYDLTFDHPSRWTICGPSASGKTTFIWKLLKKSNELFNINFDRIVYCCGSNIPEYFKSMNIELESELSNELINSFDSSKNNILIIDDQMENLSDNSEMSELYSKHSHHKNITVMFLTQNLYPKSKSNTMRNITLNSSYVVLMRNPGEKLQIRLFSNRISDGKNDKRFMDAYKDATKYPFTYLLVDQTQNIPEKLKFRTDFLNDLNTQIVYM